MVDQALIDEIKALRANPEAGKKEDALKIFKLFAAIAEEDEDLKDEVEDADLCMQFVMNPGDADEFRYWISARDGKIGYGAGEGPDVTVTLMAKREILTGMLSGEVDSTSAYMAGDLVIEGSLQDAMVFGEIASLAGEVIEDLLE